MKIAISIVRNESDVIEAFVRYHANLFDKIIVIDHNSRDDTGSVLEQLKAEGLPLEIRKETIPYHGQAQCMTALAHEVWESYRPQWIVPLDADEFFVMNCKFDQLWKEMPMKQHVLFPLWHNYVPTANDPENETNIIRKIKYKNRYINSNQHKVIIPGYLLSIPGTYLPEGNHELYYKNGSPVSYSITRSIHIAHFPVRSLDQVKRKALVGWPSKLANPANNGKSPSWSHWKLFFDKFKNGEEVTFEEMQMLAAGYTTDQNPGGMDIVEQPVEVPPGMCIKYPTKPYNPLTALADACEILAEQFMLTSRKGA